MPSPKTNGKEVINMGLAILPVAIIALMLWALWAANHFGD